MLFQHKKNRLLIFFHFPIFCVAHDLVQRREKGDHKSDKLLREVKNTGGKIKKVYYSIKRSDAGCPMRKPRIGAIKKAMKLVNKPLAHARDGYFIGDTIIDIQAGRNAGCKTIFVLSGREDRRHMRGWGRVRPNYIVKNLLEATNIILKNGHVKRAKKST